MFLTIHRVHIQLNLIKVPKVVESVHSGCSSSIPVSSSLPPHASNPGKAMKCAQFLALFFLHVKHVFFFVISLKHTSNFYEIRLLVTSCMSIVSALSELLFV